MHPRPVVMASVAAAAACALPMAAAFAVTSSTTRPGPTVAVSGGTPAQRRLASLVTKRVGAVTIQRVRFRPLSPMFRRQRLHGTELQVVSSRPMAPGLLLRAEWEQQLYVGAYLALADRYATAGVAAAVTDQTEVPAARARSFDLWGGLPPAAAVAVERKRLTQVAGCLGRSCSSCVSMRCRHARSQ